VESQPIDRVDQRILGILQNDARISWRELGDKVHLSATSVAERVRNLERRGVINGYRANISPAALGRPLRAVIDVGLPPTMSPDDFEALLLQRPEVAFAAYVTGKADYTVVVDCDGAAGLDLFIRWLKTTAGVANTESKLVLRPLAG
jgi:Lrp/AsnC family transcriptional regulator, leucine-responsive regulatory protein